MRFIIALLAFVTYVLIDAFSVASMLHISFLQALMQSYPNANIPSKIAMIVLLFIVTFFATDKKKIANTISVQEKIFRANERIALIFLSVMPFKKQLEDLQLFLAQEFSIEACLVGIYEKNSITLINDAKELSDFGILGRYNPQKEFLKDTDIEYVFVTSYMEKREQMQAVIQTKKGKKKVFAHALVCEQNPKASGVICLLGKLENDYSFLAKSISTHLAFAIFLIQKKEANIKFLEQLTQKNDSLNIPNNTALQTKIEYEFGRSKRYHTNLSLIIFQIDHLENLSNIFDEKVIINLKKNFINLIKKNIRSTDLFGTWIGEKFAIVSSDIDFRAAKNLAHKLTKILAQQHFPQVAKITCSFGITSLAQNDTMANFRQRAENALQEAIAKGGNNIEVKIVV